MIKLEEFFDLNKVKSSDEELGMPYEDKEVVHLRRKQ